MPLTRPEGGHAGIPRPLLLRAATDQVGPDGGVARLVERRTHLGGVGGYCQVDVGAVFHKKLDDAQMSLARRIDQRRFVAGYYGVRIGARFRQPSDHVGMSCLGRHDERIAVAGRRNVNPCTGSKKLIDDREFSLA